MRHPAKLFNILGWINGIIVAIKIFLIKNFSPQPHFETRSRLHRNLYIMGPPMYTIISMYTEILSYSRAIHIC